MKNISRQDVLPNKAILSLFFIILIAFLVSCKEKSMLKDSGGNGDFKPKDKFNLVISGIPDTLFSGETFNAKIHYESALDTISLSDKDERLTLLYLSSNGLPKVDMEKITKGEHKIFTTKRPGTIEFKYKLEDKGIRYLTGVIEDEVYLVDYENGKTRIITNNIKISKRVFIK